MVYKPNREVTVFDDPPNGIAIVKLIANKQLGVKFLDTNKNDFAGKRYKVSEWPEGINPRLLPDNEWKIKLNNDENGIYSISPQNGQFKVKVKRFVSKDGEDPAPKYMDKWKYPDWVFFVILEIVEGLESCIGMEIFLMLHYRFTEDKEEADEKGNPYAKYTKWDERSRTIQLDEFLTYSGGWDKGAMKFLDNLLPEFQKRIMKASKTFGVIVKNGFVDYMMPGKASAEAEEAPWDEKEDWDNLNPTDTSPEPVESDSEEFEW